MPIRPILAATCLAALAFPAAAQVATTRHYDEIVPLRPDASHVAVLPVEGAAPVDQALDVLGISGQDRRPLGIGGAVLVRVPTGATPSDHARALRNVLPGSFTTPAYFDDFGGALLPTPALIMRFAAGTPAGQQDAVLSGLVSSAGATIVEGPSWAGLSDAYKLNLPTRDGDEVITLANALSDRGDVRFAAPNWIFSGRGDYTPNDPLLPTSWFHENTGQSGGTSGEDMDVLTAWDTTLGDPFVKVLVIDVGVEQGHADINQLAGEDFVYEGSGGDAFNACDNHGTPVAGLISGIADNGIGTAGVAPGCRILSARTFITDTVACNGSWSSFFESTPNALAWAETKGVRVTNNSNAYGFTDAATEDKYAQTRADGMVHFASAGNSALSTIAYPSSLPSIQSIAASDHDGLIASFSNGGVGLALTAPGVDTLAADRTGFAGYNFGDTVSFGGTSAASPLASAVAALVLSEAPHMTPEQVEELLALTAVDHGAPGYDTVFGAGVVNAAAALEEQAKPVDLTYLKASNTDPGDWLGRAVDVDEDLLAVSALLEDSNDVGVNGNQNSNSAVDPGAVYIMRRTDNRWVQEAYVKASNTGSGDRFGQDVAIDQGTVVVGGRLEDSGGNNAGAVYVYNRIGALWTETAFLLAGNADAFDEFGYSVDVDEYTSTMVVGAIREDSSAAGVGGNQADNSLADSGAAYVYVRDTGTWSQQGYLKAAHPGLGDFLGVSVAISGNTIVVGAPREGSDGNGVGGDQTDDSAPNAGAAYVFVRDEGLGTWSQQAYLKSPDSDAGDEFGYSVAIDGDRVIVGAYLEDGSGTGINPSHDDLATGAGAAYVYVRNGTTWSLESTLKADNTGAGDGFGWTVAIDGDRAVVGALQEASNASGLDGNGADDSAAGAGAVYVYGRNALGWSQTHYVKAAASDGDDEFGFDVAISGDRLLVGAVHEDGSDVGYGGDPEDDSATDAGAAYLFELEPIVDAWTDQGCELPGLLGAPLLVGAGTLGGGSLNQVALSNALPGATSAGFVALASASVPFKGGTLKPFPFLDPIIVPVPGSGGLALPFVMPGGIPGGIELWVQWGIQDPGAVAGIALSNAVRGITP